jgi:hypothetical protein
VTAATAPPRQRPGRPPEPSGEVVLVGAHGGARVSTLAGLLRPAWDLGVITRPGPGRGPLRPVGRPVLLVTRNTVTAAARAVTAARLLAEQGVPVAVLAVIGDGLPDQPRPGTGSTSWRAASARSSGCRSCPPSGPPTTRCPSISRAAPAGRWPRSGTRP